MSSNKNQNKEVRGFRGVATIATLMMACAVTLIGVVSGLEPDVILVRCVIAGIATGIGVMCATAVVSLISKQT